MAKVSAGWMDTFASLPADKVAADAVIGGVGGMGLNYAANASSGDSGGYLGSAVGGAALGGAARGTLKKLGANRSERMANEAAEAAAARAERDAIRSANRTDLATSVKDKSVSIFGKVRDAVTRPLRNVEDQVSRSAANTNDFFAGLPGGAGWGKRTQDVGGSGQTYDAASSARTVSGGTGITGASSPGLSNAPSAQIGNSYEPPIITPNRSGGAPIQLGNQSSGPTINAGFGVNNNAPNIGGQTASKENLNTFLGGHRANGMNSFGGLSQAPASNSNIMY